MVYIFHCGKCPGGCYVSATDEAGGALNNPTICPFVPEQESNFKRITILPSSLRTAKRPSITHWVI